MKVLSFVVKNIYASRMTDDKRSMYTPIIFYIPWQEGEFVLHLRSDKNINKLNFEIGDIWEGLKLSRKSLRNNVLDMEGVTNDQRVGTIKNWGLISRELETETRVYSSVNEFISIVRSKSLRYFSVVHIQVKPMIVQTKRLTKQEIFKQYKIII